MGGPTEMDRLLALAPSALEAERSAVQSHLRRDGALELSEPCARATEAQLLAVVGLFRFWLFGVGARRLGATEAWMKLQAEASASEEHSTPPTE